MKYKYFLDTVYDLDTNPLFLIEVEDYVLLYSFKKVSKNIVNIAQGYDLLLISDNKANLVTFDPDTRDILSTSYFELSYASNTVKKKVAGELLSLSEGDIFIKTGKSKIGEHQRVPAVLLTKGNSKKKYLNIMTTAFYLRGEIQINELRCLAFKVSKEKYYDIKTNGLDLSDEKYDKYVDNNTSVLIFSDLKDAYVYSVEGLSHIRNFSLPKPGSYSIIRDDEFAQWFPGSSVDSLVEEAFISYSDTAETGVESIKNRDVYASIEKYDYLVNLNKEAELNELPVVVGREKELDEVVKNLLRIKKPSSIIIGKAGIGKSSIYELLAQKIVKKEVPNPIQDLILVEMNIGQALSGTRYRGEFEEKVNNVIKLVKKYPNIVVVVDEIHQLVGAGQSNDSTVDMSNMLKPYLARGKFRIIGCTTKEEYEMYIKPQSALNRRFNIIEMFEPSREETIEIMSSYVPVIKERFGITFNKRSLEKIYEDCKFSKGCMPDIALEAMETVAIEKYLNREVSICQ